MSYFGFFLLSRTSEKCHTQQLQTDHTHTAADTPCLRRRQPLQSCHRLHARAARRHKPPMQSLRHVSPWHVWCGGPAWRKRDAPRLPHMFDLPRPRDFRRGYCWGIFSWVWLGGWRGGTVGSCCRRGVGRKYSNTTWAQHTE